jgi:hypothetical protein
LYYFRQGDVPNQFACVKLDKDLAIENVYYQEVVSPIYTRCTCPAGQFERAPCRHSKMLTLFREAGYIGARVVFDYKTNLFLHAQEEKTAA